MLRWTWQILGDKWTRDEYMHARPSLLEMAIRWTQQLLEAAMTDKNICECLPSSSKPEDVPLQCECHSLMGHQACTVAGALGETSPASSI